VLALVATLAAGARAGLQGLFVQQTPLLTLVSSHAQRVLLCGQDSCLLKPSCIN
jgi:hypothetical protein